MDMAVTVSRPIVLGVIVALLAAWVVLSCRRRAAKRRAYWSAKTPMSDKDLVAVFEPISPDQRRFCIALRRAIAASMKAEAELLHPGDSIDGYMSLAYMVESMAGLEVMKLELGLAVDENFVAGEEIEGTGPLMGSKTLGEYVAFYLRNWDRITSPKDAGR